MEATEDIMKITITLSANAGVSIGIGGKRIWVDALHDQKQVPFSTVDVPLQCKLLKSEAFFAPDYICYTHCHPDHFSRELTTQAKHLWPGASLVLPERMFEDQILVTGDEFSVTDRDLRLRFIRLPHEGSMYRGTVHYGLLINCGGKNILLSGDCQVAAPELSALLASVRIDLALLDFPWITLRRGKRFTEEHFGNAKIVLYHLPFAQDDISGYRALAARAIEADFQRNIRILQDPLQQIEIDI